MDRNKTHRPVCKKTSGKTVCAPAQREAQKEEREMKKGKVHIIFGTGMGKTAMALGRGVSAAMHGAISDCAEASSPLTAFLND